MRRRESPIGVGLPRAAPAFLFLVLVLAACSELAVPPPPEAVPTAAPTPTPVPLAQRTATSKPCLGGQLAIGDMLTLDDAWAEGLVTAEQRALDWRDDARLVRLGVACQPLEPSFRWRGVFYSEVAQSFFYSDTGQTEPAEVDPVSVPTLPREEISFSQLHLALARAGYDDATLLSATDGVVARLNAPSDPFGPPGTPQDVVYHVAVETQGEVRDLFVSGLDWTIYAYQDEG